MQRKKTFKKTTGYYYFNIESGYKSSMTIFRPNRREAVHAYSYYLKQNKKCEWLGQWNGTEFIDTKFIAAA